MLRRSLSLFLALLFVLCLASCNKEEETPSPDAPAAETPAEDVPPVEEDDGLVDVWLLERMDRVLSKSSNYVEYEYNELGQKVWETTYNEYGGIFNKIEFKYTSDGRLFMETYYDSAGTNLAFYQYEYDEAGNLTHMEYRPQDLSRCTSVDYVYDEENRLIKRQDFKIVGRELTLEEEHEYTEEGHICHQRKYYNGELYTDNRIVFDEHGYEVSYEDFFNETKREYVRTYDEHDHLTAWRVEGYWSGISEARYSWDEEGRLYKAEYLNRDGYVESVEELIFDEHSNVIERRSENFTGQTSGQTSTATYTCVRLPKEVAENLTPNRPDDLMIVQF